MWRRTEENNKKSNPEIVQHEDATLCLRLSTPDNNNTSPLSEPCPAATHNFALANELGAELGAVQSKVDVEVDAVEGSLRRVHTLEVLFEVLARQVGRESNDLLDSCWKFALASSPSEVSREDKNTYLGPWCTPGRRRRRKHREYPRT